MTETRPQILLPRQIAANLEVARMACTSSVDTSCNGQSASFCPYRGLQGYQSCPFRCPRARGFDRTYWSAVSLYARIWQLSWFSFWPRGRHEHHLPVTPYFALLISDPVDKLRHRWLGLWSRLLRFLTTLREVGTIRVNHYYLCSLAVQKYMSAHRVDHVSTHVEYYYMIGQTRPFGFV
jgi:hypothetical protein